MISTVSVGSARNAASAVASEPLSTIKTRRTCEAVAATLAATLASGRYVTTTAQVFCRQGGGGGFGITRWKRG